MLFRVDLISEKAVLFQLSDFHFHLTDCHSQVRYQFMNRHIACLSRSVSPSNAGRSMLYVRRNTPSPPPRRPRLVRSQRGSISSEDTMATPSPPPPPLPERQVATPVAFSRVMDARRTNVRPLLRPQRSFSPSSLLPEGKLLERVRNLFKNPLI